MPFPTNLIAYCIAEEVDELAARVTITEESYDIPSRPAITTDELWTLLLLYLRTMLTDIDINTVSHRTKVHRILNSSPAEQLQLLMTPEWTNSSLATYIKYLVNREFMDELLLNINLRIQFMVSGGRVWLPHPTLVNRTNFTFAQRELGERRGDGPVRTEAFNMGIMYGETYAQHKKIGIIFLKSFSMSIDRKVICHYKKVFKEKIGTKERTMLFEENMFLQLSCPETGFINIDKFHTLLYVNKLIGGYKKSYTPSGIHLITLPTVKEISGRANNINIINQIFNPTYKSFTTNVKLNKSYFSINKSLGFIKLKRKHQYAVLHHTGIIGIYKNDTLILRPEFEPLHNIMQEEFFNALN